MTIDDSLQKATFAAGKFWGVQFYFDQLTGVIDSRVGYIGGQQKDPTPEDVLSQKTGHFEAVQIYYEPDFVNYDTLLKHFFRMHDPTSKDGQGKYLGKQFGSAVFYHNNDQKIIAEITLNKLKEKYQKPILTQVLQAGVFYEAPNEDQKYTERTGKGVTRSPFEND